MQRKLTAILAADVAGYSGLMEADEAGTLARLKDNRREIFDPEVARAGGRVFKLMGDGALVEFSSAVAAVTCALAIQEATAKAARDLPEAKRIRYRVGLNLGEVLVEGDDIYGEGVNVAARLQALAPIGGVALSQSLHDQVRGKAPLDFEDMGEHTLKNIEAPVRVFTVRRSEDEVRSVESQSRLSICVLPFANMSGDSEQEYFSDGISEDIITDLSKVSALSVISRNSAFMYKGKHIDLPKVARELKVSHVLEGSVRRAGGRVRITAQLIDAATNGHVWAERYDRDLNDIFALQDEISQAIVGALKLKLLPEEKKAIEHRGTSNPEAYQLFLMARQYRDTGNLGSRRAADLSIRLCRKAVEIDPNYAQAWALLALLLSNSKIYFEAREEDGADEAERALALDPNLADAHAAKARVLNRAVRYPEALAEFERALALDSESYDANREAAIWHTSQHNFVKAIEYFEKAASLVESEYYAAGMAVGVYQAAGDEEGSKRAARRALERIEKVLANEPDNGSALSFGVSSLFTLGEIERGQEWIARALLLDPDNINMRYNLACALITQAQRDEAGLDLLEGVITKVPTEAVNWMKVDPDMDRVRDNPRFKAMIAAAEARLAGDVASKS